MNERGKSDRPVVPANLPNKTASAVGEGRERAKGNSASKTLPGHRAGSGASNALDRVRQVARGDKLGAVHGAAAPMKGHRLRPVAASRMKGRLLRPAMW